MATVKSKTDGPADPGLNGEQTEAVNHAQGPLLIIAGAGTGKTRVVTHRIARLIEKGVNPSRILALTFTEKAAKEMEERVDRLVPYGYSTVWISTFHSFGDRVLRDNALSIGLVPDFKVLNEAECVIFLRENLFSLPLDYYRPSGDPARYLSALVKFIARLKDEDVTPDEYGDYARILARSPGPRGADYVEEQTELALCYGKYQELMARRGYLDFGDQVSLALKLLRLRPNILERYREKFTYILADEFQDTNYAQFELVKLLSGPTRNVTVVADDDQSIYKFRGAAISNVLNFKKVYPDSGTVALTLNYRSVQPILDAAYRLITHNNPDRLEVTSHIDKRLVSTRQAPEVTGSVRHFHFDTLTNESEFVAGTIDEKAANGSRSYGDFAVLVRANSDAEPYLRALGGRGVRYRFSGSSGLYQRDEIKILIALLKVITDHHDNLSLFHLASSPVYGIGASDLVPCHNLSRRRHRGLLGVMKDVSGGVFPPDGLSADGVKGIKRLVDDVSRLSEMALRETAAKVLYSFLTETGYLGVLSKDDTEEGTESVRNIAKFFDIVTGIERTLSVKKVQAFVEHLNLLIEAGDDPATVDPDADSDCVHVLTVHKSKGLEFPVVFMVGLAADRFPRRGRKDLIEVPDELIKDILPSGDFHLKEERRLFYVGMTRAMDELYLTSASDYGGVRAKKISPFVLEALDIPQAPMIKTGAREKIARFAPRVKSGSRPGPPPGDEALELSYYQIDDYLTCPLKYRYVHVLKIPLLPHHAVMYGKAVHDAISFYFKRKMEGESTTEEELLRVLRSSWRSEGFISREHEEKRWQTGAQSLRGFLQRDAERGIRPSCVERDFSADLGRYVIRGRWDIVEEREDGPYIIDFKTSDVRDGKKADKKASESVQLKLYSLSYRKNMGRLPAGCELHFVESGVVGRVSHGEKDMEKTIEMADGVFEGIRARDFTAMPDYLNCGWCAFNNICPERA
ncbi:MAG: UvrD-helicase domain-containing protein [Deltaproteobacteria bacterium]|nr:UvrD-helicase domain-containing protein [Deltaproteobacteria bacterium]